MLNAVLNLLDVIVHLAELQFLEHFANLLLLHLLRIRNAFLLEFLHHGLNDVLGNVRILLRLKLRQPFIEMIDLLVRKVRDFAGRILVTRFLRVDQDELLMTAFRTTEERLILMEGHLDIAGGTASPARFDSGPRQDATLDRRRIDDRQIFFEHLVTVETIVGVYLTGLLFGCGVE